MWSGLKRQGKPSLAQCRFDSGTRFKDNQQELSMPVFIDGDRVYHQTDSETYFLVLSHLGNIWEGYWSGRDLTVYLERLSK